VLDQDDLIQLLHDHKWLDRSLPRKGGFLDQDARFVDAMDVIDATMAELHAAKTQEAVDRARIQADLDRIKAKEAGRRGAR
jgi:hypothetical protein